MNNEPQIYGYMVLVMVSIAFFNFSGVSITKYMSATTRKVLDTLRTMVIWICQMLLHQVMIVMMIMMMMILLQASEKGDMPSFKDRFWMQLGGYVFVITGMFLYSDVIIMPYIRQRRADKKISQDAS